ncbi:hypothetical protein ACQY0O_007906 [Thecaphora frezii]
MLAGPSRPTALLQATIRRSLLAAPHRALHTTRRVLLASPPSSSTNPPPSGPSAEEPRNEALEYLEAKRRRKAAQANQPPSRHALFYRDIVPAMVRILAYGSSAYFALHLVWNLLDRDEQRILAEQKTQAFQDEIRNLDRQIEEAALNVKGKGEGASHGTRTEGAEAEDGARKGWSSWVWPFGGGKHGKQAETA